MMIEAPPSVMPVGAVAVSQAPDLNAQPSAVSPVPAAPPQDNAADVASQLQAAPAGAPRQRARRGAFTSALNQLNADTDPSD